MLNITKDFVFKDSSRLKAKTTEIQKLEFLTAKKNKNLFQTKKKIAKHVVVNIFLNNKVANI